MGRGKSGDASDFWKRYEQHKKKDFAVSVASGINSSTLSTYKSMERYPRANEAVAIARALGVTVEYLVTGKDGEDSWIQENAGFISDCKELDSACFSMIQASARVGAELTRSRKQIVTA